MAEANEGWWLPANSVKAHYMRHKRSLCGKMMCLGNPELEQGNDDSVDNCAECKKRLKKFRERGYAK